MFPFLGRNLQNVVRRTVSGTPKSGQSLVLNDSIRGLRTSSCLLTYVHDEQVHSDRIFPKPKRWNRYNEIIHPPEEGPVERYCHHSRDNIKYSPKKMFFIAGFIRGMSVDEALKQLSYVNKKGASIVSEVLEEAREKALREQNFEYKSNIWIAESFVGKGLVVKGLRKHARMRFGEVRYFHCHYFVKLVEGDPPRVWKNGPDLTKMTTEERLDGYIEKLRKRRIDFAL